MTVKEVIEKLKTFDENLEVVITWEGQISLLYDSCFQENREGFKDFYRDGDLYKTSSVLFIDGEEGL